MLANRRGNGWKMDMLSIGLQCFTGLGVFPVTGCVCTEWHFEEISCFSNKMFALIIVLIGIGLSKCFGHCQVNPLTVFVFLAPKGPKCNCDVC